MELVKNLRTNFSSEEDYKKWYGKALVEVLNPYRMSIYKRLEERYFNGESYDFTKEELAMLSRYQDLKKVVNYLRDNGLKLRNI